MVKISKEKLLSFIFALKKHGFDIDLSNFEDRIKLQKYVYFAQKMGINLGYNDFELYLRGPYSKKLARDYQELMRIVEEGD